MHDKIPFGPCDVAETQANVTSCGSNDGSVNVESTPSTSTGNDQQNKQVPSSGTENEKLLKVKVYGDGNCFFRSMVSSAISLLCECSRENSGRPTSADLFKLEGDLAIELKKSVLLLITANLDVLEKLPKDTKMPLLEYKDNQYFTSFTERVQKIKTGAEYVGALEL